MDAFRQHHAPPDLPFAMVPCAINLLDPRADLPRLIEAIEMAMERLGASPSLIIIDTLAATFGGGDENSNAMVSYVNNMAVLRDTFAALIAVVHHRPKDQSNDTLRGHGSLIGGVDAILRVDGNNIRTVTNTKQKDGEEDAPISFRLLSVPLGIDDEGEPVLSAVVDYVTVAMSKPLTGMAAAAFDALSDAIDHAEGGQVTESVWRARWTETLPVGMHDEAKRRAWSRAKASLNRSGRIQTEAGCWWVAPAAIDPVEAMNFNPLARAA